MVNMFVRILIVGDESLANKIRDILTHPQIIVDRASSVPEDRHYHFYVLGGQIDAIRAVDAIRIYGEGSPIYLSGSICDESLPIRQLLKCNLAACLESEEGMNDFINDVRSAIKQRAKIHEASCRLDCLKSGDLKTLARQMTRTKSERFVDYIQNHPLPMVLVSSEGEVLHANAAMESAIGSRLPGMKAESFWVDQNDFLETLQELKKEGQLLGREVTLKNIDGKPLQMKLYTSLHYNKAGNWLNTRCLFVPTE